MPPPPYEIANNDVVQVTWFQSYQGSTILNVHHYLAVLGTPITDGAAAITALLTDLETKFTGGAPGTRWQDLTVASWHMDFVQAQVIYPARRAYLAENINLPGLIAELGVPSNTGITVSYPSNIAARGRTGSKHFTGFPLSNLEGAEWNSGFVSDVQVFADLFRDQISAGVAGNWEAILWSASTPMDTSWPTGSFAHNSVRIMRRRTLGVGI